MRRALPALVLLALPALSQAAVLYKSVDANGTVTFSDMPPAAGTRVLETRVVSPSGTSTAAPVNAAGLPAQAPIADPMTLPLETDPMVAQANAKLDQAERELALARRELWSPRDGLRLVDRRMTSADDARVEFFKRNVAAARYALMELLRDRRSQMVASASAKDGMPRYYVSR